MNRLVTVIAVLGAIAASEAAAVAGTYDVWNCTTITAEPITAWRFVPDTTAVDAQCAMHVGVRRELPPGQIPAGTRAGWMFEAPPDTSVASYELYRSARTAVGPDGSQQVYALYHDEAVWDPGGTLVEYCLQYMLGCTGVGDLQATNAMDPDNRVARTGLNIKRVIVTLECGTPGAQTPCAAVSPPASLVMAQTRVSVRDAVPPVLTELSGGPLTAPGAVLDGPQAFAVSASDRGGGVERFAVVVDGVDVAEASVEDAASACRRPFKHPKPCPSDVKHVLGFDTSKLANGPHSLQVAAIDAGGNRALSSPMEVWIANGSAPNGTNASRQARLVAAFVGSRRKGDRRTATVPFRATRPVRGRLTRTDGTPIGDARVDVVATVVGRGSERKLEGSVRTKSNGRFRYTPRRGPSRKLRFEYRGRTLDPTPSAVAQTRLNVRAGIRLKVRPLRTGSRGTIRFAGRLVGRPGRAGVQVALYAVGRNTRNRVPVAVLRTDARGRFRFEYTFTRTFAPFTYRFQARIARQRTYPYAASASRPVMVRVVR